MIDLGDVLFKLRRKNYLTQQDVARIVGLTDKTISSWENGGLVPTLDCLIKLASFYQVPVDLITHGKVNKMTDRLEYQEEYRKKKNKAVFLFYDLPAIITLTFVIIFNSFALCTNLVYSLSNILFAGLGLMIICLRVTNKRI